MPNLPPKGKVGNNPTLRAAHEYVAAGLSIVPIARDGTKTPDTQLLPNGRWKPFQERYPTDEELRSWFDRPDPRGIAVVCGAQSGNVEQIDFDEHAEEIYPAWCDLVEAECPGLVARLCVLRTPRPAFRVAYRLPDFDPCPGNMKVAVEPYEEKGKKKIRTIIETRGEGGYAIVPGTPAACHKTGRLYEYLSGPPLTNLSGMTHEEREVLLRCAASFTRAAEQEEEPRRGTAGGAGTPGDDFNARGPDWQEVLTGWRCARSAGLKRYWARPGKDDGGWSATTGVCFNKAGQELFAVFSTNADPFPGPTGGRLCSVHTKFAAYALLNHGGDFKAAAKALAAQGYGAQRNGHPAGSGAGPAGGPDPSKPLPWPDPIPLDEAPVAPAFPVDVLPPSLRNLVQEIGWAMNVPPDYAAVPLLTFAGSAIANARHLAISRTHNQAPCLYAMTVAATGSTKGGPVRLLRKPFDEEQRKRLKKWKQDLEQWEKDDDKEGRGPKPMLSRCVAGNITTESLQILLDENPRGVLMIRDELAGLVAGFNQYKQGGDDRQFYLSLWDGSPIINDRKSDKSRGGAPVFVLNAFTGIFGTIQPDVVPHLRGHPVHGVPPPDDGFLDRWLPCYPAELPAIGEQWRDVSQGLLDVWAETVGKLLALHMQEDKDGSAHPCQVRLTDCGRRAWERFTTAHAAEMNAEDFPLFLRGAWAKLRGYAGRLALILHFLCWACEEVESDAEGLHWVDGESMTRAAMLVAYFKGHIRKIHSAMDSDRSVGDARHLLRWICRNGKPSFTRRDAYQGTKGTFTKVELLDAPLALLEKRYLIRSQPNADDIRGPGRKPSPAFDVHPSLLQTPSHNSHYSQNGAGEGNSGNSGNCGNGGGIHRWE